MNDIRNNELLSKHADWADEIKRKYSVINAENVSGIIRDEIGIVFAKVLEHAGVYKRSPEGKAAFVKFAKSVE